MALELDLRPEDLARLLEVQAERENKPRRPTGHESARSVIFREISTRDIDANIPVGLTQWTAGFNTGRWR